MMATSEFVSVETYISTLLNSPDVDLIRDEYVDEMMIEDDFEKLLEDGEFSTSAEPAGLSSDAKYISFTINGLCYIIPAVCVITLKRIQVGKPGDGVDFIDAGGLLGKSDVGHAAYNYLLFLRGDSDYVIAVDSINPFLQLSTTDLRLRKSVQTRPWLLGVSMDGQQLLLDSHVLGRTLYRLKDRDNCGTKCAVI